MNVTAEPTHWGPRWGWWGQSRPLVYKLTSLEPHFAEGKKIGFVKCHDIFVQLTMAIKNGSSQKLPEVLDFTFWVISDVSRNKMCSADCIQLLCNLNYAVSSTKLWCWIALSCSQCFVLFLQLHLLLLLMFTIMMNKRKIKWEEFRMAIVNGCS